MAKKGSAGRGVGARRKPKPEPKAASAARPALKSRAPRSRPSKRSSRSPGSRDESREAQAKLPEDFPATRYIFFGGKGGVGKTTAAAATALSLLDAARDGERILLFSTDPAHSLSDSLDMKVGDRTVEVARRGTGDDAPRLLAREMDAARALAEFKQKHRGVLAEIADRGTMLDEADINDLLDLSLPGMDEVMALFELSEVERAAAYARVVVDTAPSGHTSRMLRLPDVFARWVGALDVMSEKHRYMLAHFVRARAAREDEVDLFLRELTERVESVRSMLFDGSSSSFVLVTIPEALAFEESARYFRSLRDEGIPVTDLVVNRVEREHGRCPFCRARALMQAHWLRALGREFKRLRLRRVPLFPAEVRGADALREFARAAWTDAGGGETGRRGDGGTEEQGEKGERGRRDARMRGGRQSSSRIASPFPRPHVPPSAGFPLESKRLVIFGGKGGVGKTTAAASFALALAESDESARVLAFSTDPAHSLSDSFDERVGELKRGVAGAENLDAKEIDPAARFEELKERYRKWTDELFEQLTGGSRFEVHRRDRGALHHQRPHRRGRVQHNRPRHRADGSPPALPRTARHRARVGEDFSEAAPQVQERGTLGRRGRGTRRALEGDQARRVAPDRPGSLRVRRRRHPRTDEPRRDRQAGRETEETEDADAAASRQQRHRRGGRARVRLLRRAATRTRGSG
ncbi:MAG: hypothetical protein DMF66_09905 [Acidobacteria bacterium]|nr:MAG: hypothetical protein DMF66_09905 [Acidobacteriota bacterium]